MYGIAKNVIESGNFELSDMLKKIDTLWIQGSITEEQKLELTALAQSKANISASLDIQEKLLELDQRISVLEQLQTDTEPADEYPEYVIGKWYYNGDKITCDGDKYICIAPEGQVCTWSPFEYPAYWEKQR